MNKIHLRNSLTDRCRSASSRKASGLALVFCSIAYSIVMISAATAQERNAKSYSPHVDSKGNIALPEDFETTFVHLGTIAVAPKMGADVTELHGTYTRAEDVKAFQKDGGFPDGAILVKEVRSAKGDELTTGHARFAADVKVWFVMVKDGSGRFKDNDLWGDGWGWALFKGGDRTKQVATDYRTDCRTCHVPAKGTDWIYTQCYPLLRKAVAPSKVDTSTSEANPPKDLIARFPQWKDAVQLKGDVAKGRKYFETKTINTSLTCASCHSFDDRDTMSLDGDGLLRAGRPVYAAAHRTNIKQSGTGLVTLGANVCVVHFMKGEPPGMTAQELADMDRFLHSGGNARHATARNVDYANLKWTIPENLSGGDARKGRALAMQSCITCHSVDGTNAKVLDAAGKIEGGSFAPADLKKLALRIRNPEYKVNDEMPGYSDSRLSNQALLDILAWLTTK